MLINFYDFPKPTTKKQKLKPLCIEREFAAWYRDQRHKNMSRNSPTLSSICIVVQWLETVNCQWVKNDARERNDCLIFL